MDHTIHVCRPQTRLRKRAHRRLKSACRVVCAGDTFFLDADGVTAVECWCCGRCCCGIQASWLWAVGRQLSRLCELWSPSRGPDSQWEGLLGSQACQGPGAAAGQEADLRQLRRHHETVPVRAHSCLVHLLALDCTLLHTTQCQLAGTSLLWHVSLGIVNAWPPRVRPSRLLRRITTTPGS